MAQTDELHRISQLLEKVPSLREAFAAEPQVLWMPPVSGAPDARVLFVGIFITEKALTREGLASACSRIISELNAAKVLAKGVGLEIMTCVARGVTTERALRLRVQSRAVSNAELLTAEDLGKEHPAEGITCNLYMRTLR